MSFESIKEAAIVNRADRFLIDGLVSSKFGIIYGEPFAGKSVLAVGAVAALVNGEMEFIGRKVRLGFAGVVAFGVTDDDADHETAERLDGLVHDPSRIIVAHIDGSPGQMLADAAELKERGVKLFVLDNVTNAAGSLDLRSGTDAREFMARLQPIRDAGIAVLMVTHEPKSVGEGKGWRPAPLGSTVFRAQSRHNVHVAAAKDGRRRITVESNDSESLTILARCDWDGDTPRWSVVTAKREGEDA